jgi:CubicO group peptidase (beta-lactamase class C family)
MADSHAVGMTVIAVRGERVLFSHGYGHANLEKNIKLDPERTLFRPGSISKLFTWTAVMQLVEEGKLDLDRNISTYLDFTIPATFEEPITMRHLMSHTPGFEDRLFNLFVKDPQKLMTLREAVSLDIPRRVRPPGREIAYSNYGTMLAGYIVERVSGMPYEDYIEKRILIPLRMHHSTFRQPLPASLTGDISVGYAWDGKSIQAREFEIVNGTPAGGLSASTTDMGRFLSAHLSPNGGGILRAESMKTMHSTLFRPDARINGFAHGFTEMDTNGVHVIGHGGDTIYFHSLFFIIPQSNVGVYFSLNTGVGGGMTDMPTLKLYTKFMNTFYPSNKTGHDLAQFEAINTGEYVGDYLVNRRSESDLTKSAELFMNIRVAAEDGGGLNIRNLFTGKMESYVAIDRDLFQKADGRDLIAFLRDESGEITALFSNGLPVMTFNRPPLWENPLLNMVLGGIGLLSLLLGLILRPTGLLSLLSKSYSITPRSRFASIAAFTVIVIHLAFFGYLIRYLSGDFIFAGRPPLWPFLLPWAAFVVGLSLPYFSILAWREGWWRIPGRIFYSSFTVIMQLFFCFLWYWEFAL